MARMSIDDSVLRDPRVKKLARSMGWSRRETIGALLDVWAVCYDRVSSVLSEDDINLAAESDQFCAALVTSGLAKGLRGTAEGYRLAGVEDRIGYLESSKESGRKGGVKSGESRRRVREGTLPENRRDPSSDPQGSTNPSALPSASAPDVPSASVVLTEKRTNDAGKLSARQRLAGELWREHEAARQQLATELRVSLPVLHPMDGGRKELSARLLDAENCGEPLERTAERCRRVIARVAAECREKKNLEWFDGMIWRPDRFDRAASKPVAAVRSPPAIEVIEPNDYSHIFDGPPLWERGKE